MGAEGEPSPGRGLVATAPISVTTPQQLRQLTGSWARAGEVVGLVPTMGALHAGHLSLVDTARRDCDRVVVSIFVNPLQFAPDEDFQSYPRQLQTDLELLSAQGVDACFCPKTETLYPPGFASRVTVDAGGELWEAALRPGHFTGVATVVTKLFAATGPCRAYFGEKDAQQVAVVSRLAQDLDLGVQVRVCPTVRAPDGLALSSRNALLSPAGRRSALCLSQALREASGLFRTGVREGDQLARAAAQVISAEPGARLDYAGVVHPLDFRPVAVAGADARVLVAAGVDGVHLIDTALLGSPPLLRG